MVVASRNTPSPHPYTFGLEIAVQHAARVQVRHSLRNLLGKLDQREDGKLRLELVQVRVKRPVLAKRRHQRQVRLHRACAHEEQDALVPDFSL